MAVASVANPGERHVDPLAAQRRERQAGPDSAAKANAAANAVAEDTYTPSDNSAQTPAQAAGIFQLNPAVAAANAPQVQPATAPAATAPDASTNTAAQPQTATATPGPAANAVQQATTVTGAPAAQAAATSGAAQGQVQSLNNALAALGLSRSDIQQIDRIAALIRNFDPAAYMDLVNQFQRQVQQAQQFAAPATAGAASAPTPVGTAAAPSTAGYQLEGIAISYAAPAATVNDGAGSGVNNAPVAPRLQVQQVQFTLANGSGQTFQVQAPQQNTYAGTPNLQTPQARTGAA